LKLIQLLILSEALQSVDPPFLAFPLRGKEIKARTCVLISFPLRGM